MLICSLYTQSISQRKRERRLVNNQRSWSCFCFISVFCSSLNFWINYGGSSIVVVAAAAFQNCIGNVTQLNLILYANASFKAPSLSFPLSLSVISLTHSLLSFTHHLQPLPIYVYLSLSVSHFARLHKMYRYFRYKTKVSLKFECLSA